MYKTKNHTKTINIKTKKTIKTVNAKIKILTNDQKKYDKCKVQVLKKMIPGF